MSRSTASPVEPQAGLSGRSARAAMPDRRLPAGQTLSIDVPRGRTLRIRATVGTLWVTHPSTREDIILQPGEGRVLGEGRAVVSSLDGLARLAWQLHSAARVHGQSVG